MKHNVVDVQLFMIDYTVDSLLLHSPSSITYILDIHLYVLL